MAAAKRLTGGALVPSLAHYMTQYDHEHESGWNKFLNGVGIPMIFAGMTLLLFMKWAWRAGFFLGGWEFLFLGPRIERNNPAVFQGPIYLLAGPIWVAKEALIFLTTKHRRPASARTP